MAKGTTIAPATPATTPATIEEAGNKLPVLSTVAAEAVITQANPYDITRFFEGGFWTSLDVTQQKSRIVAMRALTTGGESLADMLNRNLEIENVLIHGVEMPVRDAAGGTTGEFTTQPRTVLFAADGTMYQCVSSGVVKSLRFLAAMMGPPPWTPPLRVVPKQINTRGGRRYFVLDLESQLPL